MGSFPIRSRRLGRTLLLAVLVVVSAAPSTGRERPATSREPDLAKTLIGILEDSEIHGAAIRTLGGERVALDWGLRDVSLSSPMDSRTRLRGGSISKLLTALLVLRAERAGVLSLRDSVEHHLGATFSPAGAQTVPVRVEHLLEHTAGIAGSSYREYARNLPRHPLAAYVDEMRPFTLRWAPGLHFSYANAGPALAARVVERVWGADFDTLMWREVLHPLGMVDSGFALSDVDDTLVSRSYLPRDPRPVSPWRMPIRPSGGLVTTADDLMRVVRMRIEQGRAPDGSVFLDEAALRRMERSETSLAAAAGVGSGSYGLGSFPFSAGGVGFRGHWGRVDGFQATLGVDARSGSGFVILVNTADRRAMGRLREAVGRALAPTRESSSRMPVEPWTTGPKIAVLEEHDVVALTEPRSGLYVNATHDMPIRAWIFRLLEAYRVEVKGEGETLRIRRPWPWSTPEAVWLEESTGGYRRLDLEWATGAFARVEGASYWIDGESFRRIPPGPFYLEWSGIVAGLAAGFGAVGAWTAGRLRRWGRRGTRATSALVEDRGLSLLALGGFCQIGLLAGFAGLGLLGELPGAAALGRIGPASLLLFALSVIGPGSAWLGLALCLATMRSQPVRLLVALPIAALGVQLAAYGWVPLRTWVE